MCSSDLAKLGPKQLGPFEVTEVLSDVDYRLALPPALRLHDVFHVDRLSPYRGNDVNGLTPPPPDPVTIDGEEEYEVEAILDSRKFRQAKRQQYLVKWKGYPDSDCHGCSVFAFIFKVVIIRYDKVARDREIVHMIITRAKNITGSHVTLG